VVSDRRAAADVVRRALESPATLGAGRLVCIDGPAGAGKTTLAAEVEAAVPDGLSCRVLHMDDVYPGWEGLADGVATVAAGVIEPLRRGEPGGYRRYDWVAGSLAERVDVPPVDLLLVEGVGSGGRAYNDVITTLVWVDAPRTTWLARGLARDGESMRERWLAWMVDEESWFARERTRERADLLLGTDPATESVQ
jgi:uridine kinase